MTERRLAGIGVLVTRPVEQADELAAAIEAEGGTAYRFPALEISPRETAAVEADARTLAAPDIVVFVSVNAVRFGQQFSADAKIAAIGPATARELLRRKSRVDLRSETGFDSEALLEMPAFKSVSGKIVRIVRGQDGRNTLGDALRSRGATVDYLSVYERRRPRKSAAELAELAQLMQSGKVNIITVMSVATLDNLLALLPRSCERRFSGTQLVTPTARVIKEALDRFPGIPAALADAPDPSAMVDAIVASGVHTPG